MEELKEVLKKYEGKKVWFYTYGASEEFKDALVALGARWNDGTLFSKDQHVGDFMAVHQDYVIAFVAAFIWVYSFYFDDYVHIDVKKLFNGEDYIIHECNIKYVSFG